VEDQVRTPHGGDRTSEESKSESFALAKGRTVDKAAKYVGMSGRTLEKAQRTKVESFHIPGGKTRDKAYREDKETFLISGPIAQLAYRWDHLVPKRPVSATQMPQPH